MTDKIPGGLAQNKTLEDIANHHDLSTHVLELELNKGIKVEMEHTTDENVAKEIAMDHLWEDPEYYTKLEKTNLEEIKLNKPNVAFKVTIPKEWEDKLIKKEDKIKCYEDIVANNVKFFQYLSDSIGENVISYVKSLLEGDPNQENQTINLFAFDIFLEAIYYYLTRLNYNPTYLSHNWDNYMYRDVVKDFKKGFINLTQIENHFKDTNQTNEIKINKPKQFAPGSKVIYKSKPEYPFIVNPELYYYNEDKDYYIINDPITGERLGVKSDQLTHYRDKSNISEKYSITTEIKQLLEYTNQDTLNPNIFNGLEIKPNVKRVLLKIANYFWENMEMNVPYEDVLLLGSSANYNWTESSDIDVHILFNFSLSGQKSEDFKKYADSFTQNFNTTYDFKIKNNPIQLYVQDVTENNHSIGVYSLVEDKWIQEPDKEKIDIPEDQIQKYAGIFKKKIDDLINSEEGNILEKIKQLKDEIKDFRQKGLDSSEGEYSIENLVFKELRHSGYLQKLYDWKTEYLNQKLSVTEVGEANIKSFNWGKSSDNTYTFTTDKGLDYVVELEQYENDKDKITVDFGISQDGNISHLETNNKDLFKVMSTIVDVIKDYVETHNNINTIIFSSIAKSGEIKRGETQRDKLYKAFIKKQLNISDDDITLRNGNYWVKFPQSVNEIKINKPVINGDLEIKVLEEIKEKVKDRIIEEIENNQEAADVAIQELINLDKLLFLKENMIENNYEFSLNGKEILASPSNIDSIGEEQIREYVEETPEIKKKLIDLFWEFYFENIEYNKYVSMVFKEIKKGSSFFTPWTMHEIKPMVEAVFDEIEEDVNPNEFWYGYEEELNQFIEKNFYKKESLQEGKREDIKQNIIGLSKFLKKKLELPYLPKVKFVNDDTENANNPLGRTAYYEPNTKYIVLYTLGRHPKDITRSFSHEVIHFKQDLDGRLTNITTQNINEDEYLAELEREAYEKGNMLFRSWENSKKLNEVKISKPSSFGVNEITPLMWLELLRTSKKHVGTILGQLKPEQQPEQTTTEWILNLPIQEKIWLYKQLTSSVLDEVKIEKPLPFNKFFKVESLKDTEYFSANHHMHVLDLGKYYTFIPSGNADDPAHKLILIDKSIVKKTEDQSDRELIMWSNNLKSPEIRDHLKNYITKTQKNGIIYIK